MMTLPMFLIKFQCYDFLDVIFECLFPSFPPVCFWGGLGGKAQNYPYEVPTTLSRLILCRSVN